MALLPLTAARRRPETEAPMSKNQILTVWGSPASGKTTVTMKMAAALSARKRNVAVVMCDAAAPSIPTVLAGKTIPDVSMGDVLTAPAITQELVLKHCIPIGKHPYVTLLGYKMGENVFTYAEYAKERAVDMLVLLRHIADYVIVDCTSVLTDNVLATAALEVADQVVRLCGCDLKALSYFASYLPLIADRKFSPGHHIKVLSATRPMLGATYDGLFGDVKYRLPYTPGVAEQGDGLKLLEPLSGRENEAYNAEIGAILQEVFGDE